MIDHYLILWPMLAMAALTFAVLSLVPMFRVGDARAGRVAPNDFKMGETDKVPEATRLYNRNYMNLLELPVLFYVICCILYMTDSLRSEELWLAWGFIVFRALHSLVHLTSNAVLLRLSMFSLAAFSLMAIWIMTFWHLAVPT